MRQALFVLGAIAAVMLPSPAVGQPVQLLHAFTTSPGYPNGRLVQAPDGSFFGVTTSGVFRLSTTGQVTEVARSDTGTPSGALVRASDGALYGTTERGGPAFRGTVFRFDPTSGLLRTVHAFQSPSEGARPLGGLVEVGGSLYGVTMGGPGAETAGTIFHVVVATGAVVTDYVFGTLSEVLAFPAGPLVLGPDGLLYGACTVGGNI